MFKSFYFNEVKQTPRKGIQHLNNMNALNFIELIEILKKNNGILDNNIAKISTKEDGFNLKFGLNLDNQFYIESSRSQPVYKSGQFRNFTINKQGKTTKVAEALEDIFITLSENKLIQNYLNDINIDKGIKVYTECLYMPLGETKDNKIKFVYMWYDKKDLSELTFILLNVTDAQGNKIDNVEEIKEDLINLSTDKIQFKTSDIEFDDIDLNDYIEEIDTYINNKELEYGKSVNEILSNSSRKRYDLNLKKDIKDGLSQYNNEISDKLSELIEDGKEGIVVKINNLMFKVISKDFTEARKFK